MAFQRKSLALLFLFVGVVSLHAVPASSGQQDDVIVTFLMVQRAEFGQVFKIVGNSSELGNWEPSAVENMTWTPGDAWASSVTLSKGVAYEYKPMVVSFDNGNSVCWAPDNNRPLSVPEDYAKSHYVETVFWKVSCGQDCQNTSACAVTGTIFEPSLRQILRSY